MVKFKTSDFLYPWQILHWRRLLWKSQYYSQEQMRQLQWRLFSKILDHCFAKVPYYRNTLAKLGLDRSDFTSLDDLSLLPIINKDIVIEHHEQFKSGDFERLRTSEIRTSGTTGKPMSVYWDAYSNILELTSQWRHFSWMGYRLGQAFMDIRSRVMDGPKGYVWNGWCRGLEFSGDYIDEKNIHEYAALLRKHRVKLWRGHPPALYWLCRLLNDAGIDDVRPGAIVSCYETLLGYQRNFIEAWSGLRICDSYGLKEHTALICQCPEGGYHIAPEYGIVEILKDDGSPAKAGEEGRIVATGLHNKTFPLLRYDIGDYTVQSDKNCPCGRTLPLVDGIVGRLQDRVMRADGRWVTGLAMAFFYADGVQQAQLVQNEPGKMDVYIVPARDYSTETESVIRTELGKKLGESMKIGVHRVAEIPFRKPGKSKFVVNTLDSARTGEIST